jgi:hypothetical protein
MAKLNHLVFGIFLGIIAPLICYVGLLFLKTRIELMVKESFLYILCIGINALIFRAYLRNNAEQTAKGVLLVTFIYAFLFFWFKSQELA